MTSVLPRIRVGAAAPAAPPPRNRTGPCPPSAACPRPSPTGSPPAKWSSGRPRWSRSWSRTRSTPAPAIESRSSRRQGPVRVDDDGCGMRPTTALAWSATPPASSRQRAQRIATLGFRGEALPSIASVAAARCSPAPRPGRRQSVGAAGGGPAGDRRGGRDPGRGARPVLQGAGPGGLPALGPGRGGGGGAGGPPAGPGPARARLRR